MKTFLILAFLATYAVAQDYCDTKLCPNGGRHIACQNPGYAPICKNTQPVTIDNTLKNFILDSHNQIRNQVAGGGLAGFSSARNMPVMKWDDELAYLAGLNIKQCAMKHDACRNTKTYPYSGQNLAWQAAYPELPDDRTCIDKGTQGWIAESENTTMSDINMYTARPTTAPVIGHFTVMVSDRNIAVGCAALRYETAALSGWYQFVLACNYAYTNMIGQPIYTAGPTASGCTSGRSTKYSNLCN